MRRLRTALLVGAAAALPATAAAQGFQAGWYIVQPGAEFAVLQLAPSETTGDSATDAATLLQVAIRPGEVVLAFEFSNGTYLVYEWFGRLSAVQGASALAPAPPEGRPGFLSEDVEFLDRVLVAPSPYLRRGVLGLTTLFEWSEELT